MKHGSECVNIPTDELVALCDLLSIAVPTSVRDIAGHYPGYPAAKPGSTTLDLALSTTDTVVTFVTPMLCVVGDIIEVETEEMLVTGVQGPSAVTVVRGVGLVAPAAHAAAAPIVFSVRSAPMDVKVRITMAIRQRADLTPGYAWPYPAQPPNWTQAPMQVALQSPITVPSEPAGEVVPPAPWTPPVIVVKRETTVVIPEP
jgi:hypothetical protein